MPRRPQDQIEVGQTYYASRLPNLDIDHFASLWHLFTVGHLVANDLDREARKLGLSFADLDLLGILPIEQREAPRATDLASSLYVSNAVISARVGRLVRAGLLQRSRSETDRRAFALRLTEKGRTTVEQAILAIAKNSQIVRFFHQLAPEDRLALTRILGGLHQSYDREFVGSARADS